METKEYFVSVMQGFNQNRNGRKLWKYCTDNGVDYKWLSDYKKTYSSSKRKEGETKPAFSQLDVIDGKTRIPEEEKPVTWEVSRLTLVSPSGDPVEIRSTNLTAVSELLRKMSL